MSATDPKRTWGLNSVGLAAFAPLGLCLYRPDIISNWMDPLTGDGKGQGELGRFEPLTEYLGLFGSGMLVDVFFLSVVHAHKGLYQLDDALCIAD